MTFVLIQGCHAPGKADGLAVAFFSVEMNLVGLGLGESIHADGSVVPNIIIFSTV